MKCPYCIKVCSKCKRILVAYSGNFNKNKNGKYGLSVYCRKCKKEYKRQFELEAKRKRERNRRQYNNNWHYYFNKRSIDRLIDKTDAKHIEREALDQLHKYFNNCCAYCGKELTKTNFTHDHIKPIFFNGKHTIFNLVIACRSCNSCKHDNNMLEWYMRQEFYSIKRLLKIYNWIGYAYIKWGNSDINK